MSKPNRLAVLGDPVAHSLSPAMHTAALQEMAATQPSFAEWSYEAIRVTQEELPEALVRLHAEGYVGVNLTLPHKVRAMELIESVDDTARSMGAVNTLVRTERGFRGTNTDGYGFLKGLESTLGRTPLGADLWLFGAGGAARGIVLGSLEAGARRVTVVNRSLERLETLEHDLREQLPGAGQRLRFSGLEGSPVDTAPDAIFINATSLGLKASDPNPVPERYLLPGTCVYDTTYGTRNQLAEACAARDVAYADGLAMLVWQGARSLEIWTGQPVPADRMQAAAEETLYKRNTNG